MAPAAHFELYYLVLYVLLLYFGGRWWTMTIVVRYTTKELRAWQRYDVKQLEKLFLDIDSGGHSDNSEVHTVKESRHVTDLPSPCQHTAVGQ